MPEITQTELKAVLGKVYEDTTLTRLTLASRVTLATPEEAVPLIAKMIEVVAVAKGLDTAYGEADPFKIRCSKIALSVLLLELGL